MNRKELTALFKAEVTDKSKEIDPDNEHHWHTLTYGWALGKGLTPKEAFEFATYIRYSTELG